MKKTSILLSCFLLISCKGMLIQSHTDSNYSEFKQSAWIEIKNTLQVEAEHARVYLQNGKQIKPSELDLYQTDCEIEVRKVLDFPQTVFPGRYEIEAISIDVSPIVFMQNNKIKYAFAGNSAPVDVKRFWKFTLKSEKYPEVMFLLCRGVQDRPSDAQLPTVVEIKQAVGDNIEVYLIQ
ncbi:MAG: hypothetical protein QM504_09890 [Pseudomonadota bacterium]